MPLVSDGDSGDIWVENPNADLWVQYDNLLNDGEPLGTAFRNAESPYVNTLSGNAYSFDKPQNDSPVVNYKDFLDLRSSFWQDRFKDKTALDAARDIFKYHGHTGLASAFNDNYFNNMQGWTPALSDEIGTFLAEQQDIDASHSQEQFTRLGSILAGPIGGITGAATGGAQTAALAGGATAGGMTALGGGDLNEVAMSGAQGAVTGAAANTGNTTGVPTGGNLDSSGFGSMFDASSYDLGGSPDLMKFIFGGKSNPSAFGSPNVLSTGLSALSGIYGLQQSRELRKLAQMALDRSDPFGSERASYAARLRELYADPSQVERLPGFKAGLTAVERKMASQGYNNSGNMMLALHDYGGRMFDAEAARLAELAGAGMRPDTASFLSGRAGASNLASRSLASLGYAARGLPQLFSYGA